MTSQSKALFSAEKILENLPGLEPTTRILRDIDGRPVEDGSGKVAVGFKGCIWEGRGEDFESAYDNFAWTFAQQGAWSDRSDASQEANDPATWLSITVLLETDGLREIALLPLSDPMA